MTLFDACLNHHPDRVEEWLKRGLDVNVKVTRVYTLQSSLCGSIVLYSENRGIRNFRYKKLSVNHPCFSTAC
jgi:hypothetical protein